MAARLLVLAVPSRLLHLLMRSSDSVPDPHVLGLILDGPHCSGFNEKDESGAGWENTQPSSFAFLHSLYSSSHLFSPSSLSLGLQQYLMQDFLLGWGKFYCNKLEVRPVSILNFSGIIPSDLMCTFLSILYFFVFRHSGSNI